MKTRILFCYLVSDAFDELPCGVFDSYLEAMEFIGCTSRTTFWRMLNDRRVINGYTVEKIFLDKYDDV